MGTQVTLVYKVDALGIAPAKISPFVASAFIPPEILASLGLRVTSDATAVAGNLITRTVVLAFDPSATAQATTVITNTSNVEAVVVDAVNDGLDYILPPIVTPNNNAREPLFDIVQGNRINKRPRQREAIFQSWLDVKASKLAVNGTGGAGYTAPIVTFLGGLPPAGFNFGVQRGFRGGCVRYVNIVDPGRGYNPLTARLNIQGGGPDGNTPPVPAQGILTLDAQGGVKSIAIVDMGEHYESVPNVFITTAPGGLPPRRPAKIFAVMAEGTPARATATVGPGTHPITAVNITQRGDNYNGVPTILIRDPTGSGASFIAQMSVSRIDVIDPGVGYFPGTTVTITPAFQAYFPPVTGSPQAQNLAFFQLLQSAISQLAITPLRSDVPLVA
jgi:hypothetical protein